LLVSKFYFAKSSLLQLHKEGSIVCVREKTSQDSILQTTEVVILRAVDVQPEQWQVVGHRVHSQETIRCFPADELVAVCRIGSSYEALIL
jgi:hypothetical protein